ncbi:hypothetical protein CTI12_AA080700 [Artemisia annua]|uniref:Homologous recombination OB-fold protein OB-fold domain-containing protein n=1 Tax=Artemisia annua TaxID=35608 RepID=A0A2U1Q2X0_ARTAN|nr:hypothetical protein CTI12_AA080700 [Artemisia annua]
MVIESQSKEISILNQKVKQLEGIQEASTKNIKSKQDAGTGQRIRSSDSDDVIMRVDDHIQGINESMDIEGTVGIIGRSGNEMGVDMDVESCENVDNYVVEDKQGNEAVIELISLKKLLVNSMETQENEDWQLSLDIDDSDLSITPVLRSNTSHQTRVEKALTIEDLEPVRIIPGPAGIVQSAKLLKTQHILEGVADSQVPTQEYIMKVAEDFADDECFTSGPWVSVVDFVHKNQGSVTGCLGNISKFMKKAPNALGDLTVTLKDPTGSVTGSVHHKVFNECTGYRRNHFTKGSALILANVLVFSPKQSSHFLNITIRNIVKVFNRDTGSENVSGLNQGGVFYSGGTTLDDAASQKRAQHVWTEQPMEEED